MGSYFVGGRSWPQIYCFWGLWETESQLQEVKELHQSSKNGVSSSSWRLKEMKVLEEMLWKGGSLKLDCLSGSAGAIAQWRSSLHLESTNWRAATLWTWMGTQRAFCKPICSTPCKYFAFKRKEGCSSCQLSLSIFGTASCPCACLIKERMKVRCSE